MSTPMLNPRLPLEIVHMIIDHLGDSYMRPELINCALVCRAWYYQCRRYIHSAIRVDYSSNKQLLHDLYAQSETLASLVRNICIDVCNEEGEPDKHSWINHDPVLPLLKAFKGVEYLALEGVSWAEIEKPTEDVLFGYKYVKDLWLATCDFPDPNDLVRLLQAYPKLHSVRMEGVCSDDEKDIGKQLLGITNALRLTWLDVGDMCTNPEVVVRWATANRTSVAIENIHITWGDKEVAALKHLLNLSGVSVHTLSLTFDANSLPSDASATTRMLVGNTGLREFRLLARLVKCAGRTTGKFIWISDCIAQLSSTYLRIIRVHVEVQDFQQANDIVWSDIDESLCEKESLKRVEVCLFKRWDGKGASSSVDKNLEVIRNAMPKLQTRAILTVMQQWT